MGLSRGLKLLDLEGLEAARRSGGCPRQRTDGPLTGTADGRLRKWGLLQSGEEPGIWGLKLRRGVRTERGFADRSTEVGDVLKDRRRRRNRKRVLSGFLHGPKRFDLSEFSWAEMDLEIKKTKYGNFLER